MIDNLKIHVINKNDFEKHIVNNSIIELKPVLDYFSTRKGQISKRGKLSNLDISITPNTATIKGSIHKFENISFYGENQNYNDFNYTSIKYLISFLIDLFNISRNTYLTNLEMGFNILIDNDPQKLIDYNILMYDLKNHNKDLKFFGKGDFKQFIKTDYSLKIYNKSKPYGLDYNVLRIELKITAKRFLQKLGVFSLEDLEDKSVLRKIFLFLYDEFEKVLIIDDFENLDIPLIDLDRLYIYTNPHYWTKVRKGKSLKVLRGLERDFCRLIKKYNLGKSKSVLKEKLLIKFNHLINSNNQDFHPRKVA